MPASTAPIPAPRPPQQIAAGRHHQHMTQTLRPHHLCQRITHQPLQQTKRRAHPHNRAQPLQQSRADRQPQSTTITTRLGQQKRPDHRLAMSRAHRMQHTIHKPRAHQRPPRPHILRMTQIREQHGNRTPVRILPTLHLEQQTLPETQQHIGKQPTRRHKQHTQQHQQPAAPRHRHDHSAFSAKKRPKSKAGLSLTSKAAACARKPSSGAASCKASVQPCASRGCSRACSISA